MSVHRDRTVELHAVEGDSGTIDHRRWLVRVDIALVGWSELAVGYTRDIHLRPRIVIDWAFVSKHRSVKSRIDGRAVRIVSVVITATVRLIALLCVLRLILRVGLVTRRVGRV